MQKHTLFLCIILFSLLLFNCPFGEEDKHSYNPGVEEYPIKHDYKPGKIKVGVQISDNTLNNHDFWFMIVNHDEDYNDPPIASNEGVINNDYGECCAIDATGDDYIFDSGFYNIYLWVDVNGDFPNFEPDASIDKFGEMNDVLVDGDIDPVFYYDEMVFW